MEYRLTENEWYDLHREWRPRLVADERNSEGGRTRTWYLPDGSQAIEEHIPYFPEPLFVLVTAARSDTKGH